MTGEAQTLSLLSSLSCRGWRQLTAALDLKEDEGTERLCARATCASTIAAAEKAMFGAQLSKFLEEPVTPTSSSSSSSAAEVTANTGRPAGETYYFTILIALTADSLVDSLTD